MNNSEVVVHFSGGIASWAAGKRAAERYGSENVTLLFADTMMEDEDLYRFLEEGARNIGAPLVKIADGRTIWDVFRDERFLGNSRFDPCSRILKRDLLGKWVAENRPGSIQVFGFDWAEQHRFDQLRERIPEAVAPLLDKPLLSRRALIAWALTEGLQPPRLYSLGFEHNNCGGGCVKAGQAAFAKLYRALPERYAQWEKNEQAMRDLLGNVSILTDRSGDGKKKPLTLKEFRQRIPKDLFDKEDFGVCGCFQQEPLEVVG